MQANCIHTPRVHGRGTAAALSRRPSAAAGDASAAANQQNKAWSDILAVFDDLLAKLKGVLCLEALGFSN